MTWWERGVIYQIYPRSFQDSDGDGIGDIKGIEQRLDYLVTLGIDAIWISPFYPSPMADFGYDVADYCDIDPRFGTLDDFDRLLAAAKSRGLKVVLDFVPNHSSDQHPWFIESRSSRTNARRDWYIWRDKPNNWISDFGGSAWEWDDASQQYFYHAFLKQQPDLNWRNPAVREAMFEVLHFWFARGVDGFRIDVLWHLIKAIDFPDNPLNPAYQSSMGEMHRVHQTHSADQPEIHGIAAAMRKIADSYRERLLIGEICLPITRLMTYYGADNERGVHLPFNFNLLEAAWNARGLRTMIAEYEAALPAGAWPNWVIGSHDAKRVTARLGEAQARVAAMLILTLRGTPTLYCGDEIGIGHVDIPKDAVRDPRELREPGLGLGRDPARTPMAWDASPNAGFTTGNASWLPLHSDWQQRNVATQAEAPTSIYALYRHLLALRRAHEALAIGEITLLLDTQDDVLAYERSAGNERCSIALNLSDASRGLPEKMRRARLLASTIDVHHGDDGAAMTAGLLRPNEGVIVITS